MSTNLETLEIHSQKIVLDFSRNNYVNVLAKQYDRKSRYITVKLANNGQPVIINPDYTVHFKVLTPDDRAILETVKSTNIKEDGTILLELTESMLSVPGKAEAELCIYDLRQEGESRLLTTMNFCISINACTYGNDRVIASDEFNALVDLYERLSNLSLDISDEVVLRSEPTGQKEGDYWMLPY